MNTEGYRSGHNEAVLKTVWGNPRGFESHSLRQKRTKRKLRSFFIQAAGLAYHHRAKCGAYHQGRVAPLHIITRQRVSSCGLMIYRNKLRMIYKACALIYFRKCDIINSPINKNLTEAILWQAILLLFL